MKRVLLALSCLAMLVGCENKPQVGEADTSETKQFGSEGMNVSGMARPTNNERVIATTTVKLIGRHKGAEPKPRHITFMMPPDCQVYMPGGKFEAMESFRIGFVMEMLDVELEASGLDKEQAGKLAEHLRGPDFFNTKQHRTAMFETSSVKLNPDGTGTVVGKLKMLGQEQELTIPVTHNAEKKVLEAKFDLDRTQFGMTYGVDSIEEKVEVQISLDVSNG
ncbi:MAG: YceI family protein [Planctomycetaceae bacterium]|nr:YceI family protein [Planctomycetaceae bacterium]